MPGAACPCVPPPAFPVVMHIANEVWQAPLCRNYSLLYVSFFHYGLTVPVLFSIMMKEDQLSQENDPTPFQLDPQSHSSYVAHYHRNIFGALVWLKYEHEALALAAVIEDATSQAEVLCTIAEHLRMRGDGEKQQILPLLVQAQECLASLQGQGGSSRIQQWLVEELVCWQEWSRAQEVADSTNDFWGRVWTLGPIFRHRLQDGMWKEALAVARSASESGHWWMLCSLCEALAREHAWKDATEVAALISHPACKVEALSALARELAASSQVERAQVLWQQAIQTAFNERGAIWVSGKLCEELASARQWNLAESVARALTLPLPAAKASAREDGRSLDQQSHERIDVLWLPVVRSKAQATLAREYTKAQHWEEARRCWEEARALTSVCTSTWHQTVALGNLTLCLAEVDLWEEALATWREAETVWKEARARGPQGISQEMFEAYGGEEEQRRLKVLVPLSRHLVKARRWRQAWKLCCELEEVEMKIKVGRVIARAMDQLQQSEDAQIVWQQTCEVALSTQLWAHDLADLALDLQQAGCLREADMVWAASVASLLQDDHRAINGSSLALELAQAQQRERAMLVLQESMRATILSVESDFQ